ncbi:MAG: hypothetical protein U5R14_01070 [Gemmatimonadota bacterium]|nr:hypothetical protein [Gemmatimonadota bacterium]
MLLTFDEGSTVEKQNADKKQDAGKNQNAVKRFARIKTLKYLLRHPFTGTRNLLALRGARSLVTRKSAAVTAAVAATAVAVPLALRKGKNAEGSEEEDKS